MQFMCMYPPHPKQVAPIIERGLSKEVPEQAPSPAAALPELQQPLMAEEAPPPSPAGERAGLSKALAIIRWAWAWAWGMGGWHAASC